MADVVTRTDLENGKVDLDDLADVVNGSATLNGAGTVTTRQGGVVRTLAKAIQEVTGRFITGGPVDGVALTNVTSLSGEKTIDGESRTTGDRVLLAAQSTASQNGVWVVATGAWTRATDMDAAADFFGALVSVREGSAGAGTVWFCQTRVTTVGSTAVTFSNAYDLTGLVAAKADATEVDALAKTVGRLGRNALELSENLLDTLDPDFTLDFFVDSTTGALWPNVDYEASGYIPVTAGLPYYMPARRWYAWYNASKTYISGADNTSGAGVLTAPSGAAFLRVSLHNAGGWTTANFYVKQGDTAMSPFQAYGVSVVGSKLTDIGTLSLENEAVTPQKTSFLVPSKNLFSKAAAAPNTFAGSDGAPVTNSTYALSDYIKVEEGETYFGRAATQPMRFWAAYDANLTVIGSAGSNTGGNTFTVPVGVKYYRITVFQSQIDSFQLEKGTSQTGFADYGYSFDNDQVNIQPNWAGAITYSYGDSITAQASWQPGVTAAFGLVHTVFGIGGRRVSGASGMCQTASIEVMPEGADLLMVLGGTNDWAGSVPLGALNSTDDTEFYGALNLLCERLTTRFPDATILLLTTPYGELPGRLTDGSGWPSAAVNNQGLTTRAYAEAVRETGKRWGFPVSDMSRCGWNEVNIVDFMNADGGLLHPNSVGSARMARVVIGDLRALEPLDAVTA